MSELVPYTRPRGSIHDLNHLLSLSSDRCVFLCVSEQELYVLHNWLALDLEFESRYALTLQYNGYEPLSKDSELWGSWLAFVRGFQIGARDMSCNIEAGLTAIADSLQALADRPCCGSATGGSYPGGSGAYLPCLSNVPDENYLPTEPATVEPGTPPPGFDTWEEYQLYKCAAANWLWRWNRQNLQYFRNLDAMALATVVLVPILAGIFLTLEAPPVAAMAAIIGVALEIAILAGAAWWYLDQALQYWDDHREDIVCALYTSGSSTEAAEALVIKASDAIEAITAWGALEPIAPQIAELLGTLFSQLIGDNSTKVLFIATAAVQAAIDPTNVDCDLCAPTGDCNDFRQLLWGTGNLYGLGERTLTSTFDAATSKHRINALFQRGTCIKFVSTTAPAQLYKSYRCDNGSIVGPHWTGGDANNAWMCSGQFTGESTIAFSIVMDIQGDDCIGTDENCP